MAEKFEPVIIKEPLLPGMFMALALEIEGGVNYDRHSKNSTVITSASCTRNELLRALKYPIQEE